jgi:hypothetical protein
VLDEIRQLRSIALGPNFKARLSLRTSLNFRMDSLSADNVDLL